MGRQPQSASGEPQAKALANLFEADYPQTFAALQRLLDDKVPTLIFQQDDLPESDAVDLATSVLSEAYRSLSWQQALDFLAKISPTELAERLRVSSYLADGSNDGVPLFSRKELADALNDLLKFFAADREHMLRTGLPTKEFGTSRWIEAQLAKLYPVQCTEYHEPFEAPVLYRGNDAWYYWAKVVPDAQGIIAEKVRVPQNEADFLEGFNAADALRLDQLRERVLNLKLTVLQEAERALRSPDKSDVWSACLPHFVAALSADEAEFLSRMDSAYQNPPAGNLSHSLAALLGQRVPYEPGGFSNMIELVRHVQQECTIGTMHKTREALGELVAYERSSPVLCSSSRWPYFDFVDEGYSQKVFENAVRTFLECEAKEIDFWPQFHDRVTAAVREEFNREIVIDIRSRPSIAEKLKLNIASYAEFAKSCLEVSGELPALQLEPLARKSNGGGGGASSEVGAADGPCHPYTWRHCGKRVKDKMQPAAWNMINHLWQQQGHSASFDDLKKPVYDDLDHEADNDAFGALRRAANGFFKKHKIPWRVTLRKTTVSLTPGE